METCEYVIKSHGNGQRFEIIRFYEEYCESAIGDHGSKKNRAKYMDASEW